MQKLTLQALSVVRVPSILKVVHTLSYCTECTMELSPS